MACGNDQAGISKPSSQCRHVFHLQVPGKKASDEIVFLVAFPYVPNFGPQFWSQTSAWLGWFQFQPSSRFHALVCQNTDAYNRNVMNPNDEFAFVKAKPNGLNGIAGMAD